MVGVIGLVGVRVGVAVWKGVKVGRRVGVGPVLVGAGVLVGGKVGVMVGVTVWLGVSVGTVGVGVGTGVSVQAGGSVGKTGAVRSVPGTTRVTSTGCGLDGMGVVRLSRLYCTARMTITPATSTISTIVTIVRSAPDEREEGFTRRSLSKGG